MYRQGTETETEPRYPVCGAAEAEQRANVVVDTVGLGTDVGLDDRLSSVLKQWLDEPILRQCTDEAAARDLANEAYHLYQLLTNPERNAPDKPVDAVALHRALVLAMTRPAEDPCWRDYQAVLTAIGQHHRAVQAGYRVGPVTRIRRTLTRWEPDKADVDAWVRPVAEARKRFTSTWRTEAS